MSPASSFPSSDSESSSSSSSSHVLTAKYLERHTNKKELIQRLRTIVQVLQHDESVEADSMEFTGLAALCLSLSQFVDHRDKQVRMHTVSACMELFTIYAPDAPWDQAATLNIFRQTIRQLANLAHTTSPSQANFAQYKRILELLAEVKIGVLLVDLNKAGDEETSGEALQVLAELYRTVLQSVRNDHPHEIFEMASKTITGCLEEYYEGSFIPIPLLDELLICIGKGPLVLVTNPAKAAEVAAKRKKTKLPPHQIEQQNPSYLVATAIVRKTVDRLSTPIANLLNGLLNSDTRIVAESSILTKPPADLKLSRPQQQDQTSEANVWSIVYEFHKIAPSVLTTVIGTVANYLTSPELEVRRMVVNLFGRLFSGPNAKLAMQFRPCFREWLKRANDIEPEVRLAMIEFLLKLVPSEVREISEEAQQFLKKPLTEDSSLEVRLQTIYGLCDIAHRHRDSISPHLWQMVGSRVSSRNKQERKDALTGLAQTYFRQYVVHHLGHVQDDCSLDIVQNALSVCLDNYETDQYYWIPTKVFESASFTDTIDSEMRSRVTQSMDDLLLGSELPNSNKQLTSTARAVGLAVIVHTLKQDSSVNPYSWMCDLMVRRSKVQKALEKYIIARSEIRNHKSGSEEAFAADAKALDLLEAVASLTAPPNSSSNTNERNPVLETFHKAKDKHVFRILSTITNPTHSTKARSRAIEEMPKRVKSMGEATLTWVKVLVRRCAMGDFLNQEIVRHCILLAQECFQEKDIASSQKFLACVQVAADSFPELCANEECFESLMELFVDCRRVSSSELKTEIGRHGFLTTLSTILSAVAPCTQSGKIQIDDSVNELLLNLCCRDGTPEQARHAVSTMAALFNPNSNESLTHEQNESFSHLLHNLTSPSKLTMSGKSTKLVTVLVSLAELTQYAPMVFNSKRGKKAIRFALEMVLLGRAHLSEETYTSGDDEDIKEEKNETVTSPSTSRRRRKSSKSGRESKHRSPDRSTSIVEDATLSASCRSICAAIELLVSFIRTTVLSKKSPSYISQRNEEQDESPLSNQMIEKVFLTLSQIIRDHGVPPSNRDKKECRVRQDRAALRQCASIHFLRLCDPRLGFDRNFLTPERWHILGGAFLDDECVVRDALMKELSLMLSGHGKFGKYGNHGPMVPLLRLVAFVVFCVDGDNGAGHVANGNAASIGAKKTANIKNYARNCVVSLRKAYEVSAAQARANGEEAERRFEKCIKVALMPEYVVPYAIHLLSFRRETPFIGKGHNTKKAGIKASRQEDKDDFVEAGQRILRKRLKWLFDPLVLSLGDSADNISFLLRMTELAGKCEPIKVSRKSFPAGQLSYASGNEDAAKRESAKLDVVCAAAREVLLSYVKKDVNLAVYPGKITLPGHLFRRNKTTINSKTSGKALAKMQDEEVTISKRDSMDVDVAHRGSKQSISHVSRDSLHSENGELSKGTTLEHGSPLSRSTDAEGSVPFSLEQESPAAIFGDLSPIRNSSPGVTTNKGESPIMPSSDEKTRGSSPPSEVRNTRFTPSASVAMEVPTVSERSKDLSSSSLKESKASSRLKKKRSSRSSDQGLADSKRQKGRLPAQIKVARQKTKPGPIVRRRTRSLTKVKDDDNLDFAESSKKAANGKENQTQSRKPKSRGKMKRISRTLKSII